MILRLKREASPFNLNVENSRKKTIKIDAAKKIGGEGEEFRPMELLASGLASCLSIDVLNILRKKKLEPEHFSVKLEAKREKNIPSIFEKIHLEFQVSNDVTTAVLDKTIQLALTKYCSVAKILEPTCDINYSIIQI